MKSCWPRTVTKTSMQVLFTFCFPVTAKVDEFGKYGLYYNNSVLYCWQCGKKLEQAHGCFNKTCYH